MRAGEVSQVVEHLPSKCEALSSNPSTAKKKKKKKKKEKNPISDRKDLHTTKDRWAPWTQ
jgi:hypothetical protein